MPYELTRIDALVFVDIRAAPTEGSVLDLCTSLSAARMDAGRPPVLIIRLPAEAHAVSAEMRPTMAEFGKYVSGLCREVHLVVEATGFRGTVLRSAITAVVMVTRERNLTVHRSLADAFDAVHHWIPSDRRAEVEALLPPAAPVS
jgi:hypothetical protein